MIFLTWSAAMGRPLLYGICYVRDDLTRPKPGVTDLERSRLSTWRPLLYCTVKQQGISNTTPSTDG